ncbi:MAG TPA: chorismate mutase [Gemmatimonadaceae bacterium]|nr:chorismate mutase [Gemmatimonadaceae bacterium]
MVKPSAVGTELEELRAEIERIDESVIAAIEARQRLARRIGQLKRAAGMTLVQPAREAAVVRRAAEIARSSGLDPESVREIFWRLIDMSRRAQADAAAVTDGGLDPSGEEAR